MELAVTITNQEFSDAASFEKQVRTAFDFLESDSGMAFAGAKELCGDPRDSGVVARYKSEGIKIDIGWNKTDLSLMVLIHLNRESLPRRARHVYLESFVEYLTGGAETAIVPQVYYGMSDESLLNLMRRRKELFASNEFSQLLTLLSSKLHKHIEGIRNASDDVVGGYHQWMEAMGGR